jgi:uncharacterized protein (UPF0333 family)
MNQKGQVAFESLFLSLIVITAGIFITGYYLQLHQDTVALFTAKTEIMNQLNKTSFESSIDQLKIVKTADGNVTLNIKISPTMNLDLNAIKEKIKGATTYKNITINQK